MLHQHLEEAVRVLELRRYRRILASGRLPFAFAAGILLLAGLMIPFLFGDQGVMAGRYPITTFRGWPAGVLLTTCALGAGLGGYLRVQQLWHQERRQQGFQSWLLSGLSPARTGLTTILMASVLGLALVAVPTAIGLVLALFGGLAWWQWLLYLVLYPVCALFGSALGTLTFFSSFQLTPKLLFYPVVIALGLAVGLLWLRIETVEGGWRKGWEEHPGRITRSLALATPVPVLFGSAAPKWWDTFGARSLGLRLPVAPAALLYAGCLLLAAMYIGFAGVRGYMALAADPDRADAKPRAPTDDPGQEFYWQGFRNPILTRDVRTRLRSKDTAEFIFFASIAVAAGAFVPLLMTASDLSDPLQTASAARQVFFWLTMTLVALAALVGPSLTADSITQERATGALELLVATPMRPRQILAGKLAGAVAVLMLLISPSLPLFGLCYLFHGASGPQVLGVFSLLLATLVLAALVGVTQSSINQKGGSAKFWAYAVTCGLVAVPGGPCWIAVAIAAPDAGMRKMLVTNGIGVTALIAVIAAFVLVLFWGNACEQLEYSEY